MKIQIPKTIMTEHGEVELLPYNSCTAYMKGLIDGWKAGFKEAVRSLLSVTPNSIEFIEIGENGKDKT